MSETSPEEPTKWDLGEMTRGTPETESTIRVEIKHFTLFSIIGYVDPAKPEPRLVQLQTSDSPVTDPKPGEKTNLQSTTVNSSPPEHILSELSDMMNLWYILTQEVSGVCRVRQRPFVQINQSAKLSW